MALSEPVRAIRIIAQGWHNVKKKQKSRINKGNWGLKVCYNAYREVFNMALTITPAKPSKEITRLECPACREKVRGVGLLRDSLVDGLTFTCKRCRALWHIKTT